MAPKFQSYKIGIELSENAPIVTMPSQGVEEHAITVELPEDLKQLKSYLSNPNSKIYQYRIIKKRLIMEAIAMVNAVIKKCFNNECSNPDLMYALSASGYYKTRIIDIAYKVASVLSILIKHIGGYNYDEYCSFEDEVRKEYHYKDVAFILSEDLKAICGKHSVSDYQVIKAILEESGAIKELSSHWKFKSEYYDENLDEIREYGDAIAKPYWINPDVQKSILEDDEMVKIPARGIFNGTATKISKMPLSYFGSLRGILYFIISEELYRAAQDRLKMGALKRVVNEFHEEAEDENIRCTWMNKVPVPVTTQSGKSYGYISMTIQSAYVISAIHDHDLFTLLRFTIDDYSGRFHTVITRLAKDAREHLKLSNGESLADVDYVSFQAKLYAAMMAKYGFRQIAEFIGDKDFYKCMVALSTEREYDKFELTSDERAKAKKQFMLGNFSTGKHFRDFVALMAKYINKSTNGDKQKVDLFIALMYALADGSSKLNKIEGFEVKARKSMTTRGGIVRDYVPSSIPKRLQSMEVDIMFGEHGVAERLNAEGIIFTTIHDAIIVPESKVKRAEEIMRLVTIEKTKCDCYGLELNTKSEVLHPYRENELTWEIDDTISLNTKKVA